MMNKERFQTELNKRLDKIGLDEIETDKRVLYRQKLSAAKDLSGKLLSRRNHVEKIFVGSHADGTGFSHCNDLDILQVNHAVSCHFGEKLVDTEKVNFQAESQDDAPGYVVLKLTSKGNRENFETIEDSLVEVDGETYISSRVFKTKASDTGAFQQNNGWIEKITEHKPSTGPSIPKCTKQNSKEKEVLSMLQLKSYDTDVVGAFPCDAGPIIEKWTNRERKNGWPSKETIANVARLPAHVVPIGQRGTDNEDLQWRICFTLGEILLVQKFNNVQRKLFFLMKIIARHFLKPICNDISSYVMKNVIFWISEEMPEKAFNDRNLIKTLQTALKYLLKSIKRKYLSNYMMPERNLFEGKFNENDQVHQKLVTEVKRCIKQQEKKIKEMKQVFKEFEWAGLIDKIESTILESLTREELAEMYIKMNTCQSEEDMQLLNFHYRAVPFLMLFGTKWFSSTDIKKIKSDLYEYSRKDLRTYGGKRDLGIHCVPSAFNVGQRAINKYNSYHGYGRLFFSYHVFVFLPHCCA